MSNFRNFFIDLIFSAFLGRTGRKKSEDVVEIKKLENVTNESGPSQVPSAARYSPVNRAKNEREEENDQANSEQDDPTGLEGAAFASRLPVDKMTLLEAACFPDIAQGPPQMQKVFIHIRKRIVQFWFDIQNSSRFLKMHYCRLNLHIILMSCL